MTAESLIRLIEEMVDIKIQLHAEPSMKLTPEIARIIGDKRETDRRRLEQIRLELVRFLQE